MSCCFCQVNFEPDARQQYLKLLGYGHLSVKEQLNEALLKCKEMKLDQQEADAVTVDDQVSMPTCLTGVAGMSSK